MGNPSHRCCIRPLKGDASLGPYIDVRAFLSPVLCATGAFGPGCGVRMWTIPVDIPNSMEIDNFSWVDGRALLAATSGSV